MFCLQMMGGRQVHVAKNYFRNLKKYVCENNYGRYMVKQLFTSVLVNNLEIYFYFGV